MTKLTGQCLCGDVTFKADGRVLRTANCHCTDCRKATGSVYGTLVFMKKMDVDISGKTESYAHKVDSGNTLTKQFCPRCGAQMFGGNAAADHILAIRAGVINESEAIAPEINVYTSSRLASTPVNDDLPGFEKMPG